MIVFGSYVAGTATEKSDIDVLIVTENAKEVNEKTKEVEELFGRKINLHIFNKKEIFKQEDYLVKNTLLNGLFYTLGRGISYTILALLIYFGLSSFKISRIFQGWGDKILGPVLIIIGLVMFNVIKINIKGSSEKIDKIKVWLSNKGYVGSLLLGMLFAMAFCPYSGVLFFGALMPLVLKTTGGVFLPPLFALGTGLPVIIFSFLIAFSMQKVSKAFQIVQKIEKVMRYSVATVFIITGIYYMQYLIKYLVS